MLRSGRWWGLVPVTAVCCAAVLTLGAGSEGAGARRVTAHAAGCGSGGSSGGFYAYGGGTKVVSQVDIPVCATGRLTVTFAGDPAAGCAAEGLCEYSGTETYAPDPQNQGDLSLVTLDHNGHRKTEVSLSMGGPSSLVTSAVQRTSSGATGTQTTSCSDSAGTAQEFDGSSFTVPVSHGRVTIALDHAQPALLGSRCAGPLDVDLASVLPSRTLALRVLERGASTVDLPGGGTFSAHGLSGTLSSTLKLTLGRPQREKQGLPPAQPRRTRVTRFANVIYHVSRLTGNAVATVQSSATRAVCGPFDACGLGGTISVLPGTTVRGGAFLTADSTHETTSQLRAVLRGAGGSNSRIFGGGTANVNGSVEADLMQSGVTCTDEVALRQFDIRLTRNGDHMVASLAPAQSQATDPLRTRCPGPDVGSHHFASAGVPASVLGRRAFSVTLHGLAFADGPYRVTTRSTLRLTLRRGRTRVQVLKLPAAQSSSIRRSW